MLLVMVTRENCTTAPLKKGGTSKGDGLQPSAKCCGVRVANQPVTGRATGFSPKSLLEAPNDGYGVYESLAHERCDALILIACWATRGAEVLGEARGVAWIVGQIRQLDAIEKPSAVGHAAWAKAKRSTAHPSA